MLVLKVKPGETVRVGPDVAIYYTPTRRLEVVTERHVAYGPDAALIGGTILVKPLDGWRMSIEAPRSVLILRDELIARAARNA